MTSPYTPGEVARAVPGRAAQLRFYTERAEEIDKLGRFVARVRVEHASRGVGKTSLLREAQRTFERAGIKTVWVTANEDEKLLPAVLSELRHLLPAAKRKSAELVELIDSVTVSLGAGPAKASVTVKPGAAAPSAGKAFRDVLRTVSGTLDSGVVILIDEVQAGDRPSLRALAYGWQELASDPEAPAAGLFLVGLPGSVDHIISAITFAERFDFQPLAGLDDAGATEALVQPAQSLGVTWALDALRLAVAESNGYPFKVQLMGDAVWSAAGDPGQGEKIVVDHVRAALPVVNGQMRILFTARWRSASKGQRALLIAAAELGGVDVKRDDIAARLGMSTQSISTARDGLLRKGILDATGHGRLSFTLPGFAEYVLSQA